MGMSVAEFMDVLGCPSSATERSNCDSGGFVWPKHTELEVRDPWSGVYQYEPADVSWCVRFKALGCYNYVPPPFTDRSYKVPTTPQLVPDNKEVIKNDQASPDNAGFQTLLKMRPPAEKSEVLPPETITPAERHKLWEDLLLSDSDEDNNEKSRSPTAVKTTIFETPAVNEELLGKANSMCAATKLELLNHALRPPPPFVSPLSIINDEGSGTESLAPSPHNDQVLCSQINQEERFNDSRNVPEVHNEPSVNKSSLALVSSPRESEIFNTENVSCKRLSATVVTSDRLPISAQTTVVSDITNIPSKLPTTTSTLPPKTISPAMPKAVTVSNDKSKSEAVHKPSNDMITSAGKEIYSQHCKTPEARKSFIQRLLLESKEFLSQKDSLFVELSPIHNKNQHNVVVSSPKILPHSESGRTAFIEQKSAGNAFDANDTSKTSLNDMNLTSNSYKSSLQESVQLDSVVGQCKITSRQLSSHHDKRKDSVEVNDNTVNPKLSKLNSSSASQGTPKPSPVKSDSRPSSLSKLSNDELLRAVNLNLGLHKPDIESEKDKLEVDEINESKTSVSGIQTPVTNPDSCHSNASSVNNMPPPTHDSTGKKLKKRSKCSTELTTETICQSPAISEPSQENIADKVEEEEEGDSTFVIESNQDTAGIYPLRDIPSDCWVFSDLTVTKVRNTIQQSFPHALNSSGTKDSDDAPTDLTSSSDDLIRKMRDILRSAIESDSPINSKTVSNRRNRPRSLTGILLVPPSDSPCPSPETKLPTHHSIDIPQKSYCEIFTMTSPYCCHPTIPSSDADIQCDIWPSNSSNNNSHLSTRFASQCSSGIVSTPTQKPLGTVPPILRDPTSDLTTLSSSTTQSLPQFSNHSMPSVNLVDSLCFIEEQFGRIIKQEDEKLQNSNASTEIFKAEECKFEASRCWKSLVSSISSTSRGNSIEASNRSQMLLTLQALHEYPVQMTKSVRHYLAAAHIFESKNESNRAIGMLTEAADQIQHCVRRMHRVEAKLTKRRNHRNESGNSPDNNNSNNNMNELALKVKRDASWMYLWYYVLMRIKAVVGFHIYRLRLQSIESLHEEIDASISVIQHTIPSLKEIINIPKSLDSPPSSSSKPSSSKPQIPSNPSSESDSKKILESLVGQFVRLNQLTACVRSAMVEWQQANELATKVPHLKSPAVIPSTGRKPDGSSADNLSSSSSSSSSSLPSGHHHRLTHSIDIDIANASDGAHINTSQIPLLILLRYMDGIFHVHSQIIDQLKCPTERQETGQSAIISTKYNSNELRGSSSLVSQEQRIIPSLSTMANNPISSSSSSTSGTSTGLSTVTTKLSTKEDSAHSKVIPNSTSSIVFSTGSNMVFQTDTTPTTTNNVVKKQSSKKKSHRKHSDITAFPNAMTSSATKLSPYQNSNPLDDNCSDTSVPSSKHEKQLSTFKQKSKRRRLVQLDTSVNTSSSDSDTDIENCEATATAPPPPPTVVNKYKQSPVKKRHKSRLETDTDQEFIDHRKKQDRIDNSCSQESRHSLSTKKSSKRSHMPPVEQHHHSHLQGRGDGNSHSENRIPASDDDQSPNDASPPPSRKFCRSKSVAPITSRSPKCHVNSVTNVQNSHYTMMPTSEDNTYEPKRIKSTSTKVHHRRVSNSESSDSGSSSPTPTYRPSIPLNSPDNTSRRRRSRSVHLSSSSSKHKNASPIIKTPKTPQDELSHDSIGYSPTKGNFLNGNPSDINNLPVYYVSQIPSSPPSSQPPPPPTSKSQHSNRSVTTTSINNNNNNNHNDLYRSKSSHRSEVPSFYARWIKEPSNTTDHRFSSSSVNSYGNSSNNTRRHRSQW
nr:unnamed protein product [Trichobilharzia regenti]